MRDSELFSQRAVECRDQAGHTDLDNVRERCLRAEAAWTAMAARAQRTEAARDRRDAKQDEAA